MRLPVLAGALFLASCASVPPPGQPGRAELQTLQTFALEARFALKSERPNEAPQSASGRLTWQHAASHDHILVADPLGQGIAEISVTPAGAELRASDGQTRRAADAATLLYGVTGYALPLGELPAWLLGRPSSAGRLETDGSGRPYRLMDDGWRIDYDYDSADADAPPARLTVHRESELELRLRIEEWRPLPHD